MVVNITDSTHFPPTLIPTAFFFLSFKLLYQQLGYDENDTAYV